MSPIMHIVLRGDDHRLSDINGKIIDPLPVQHRKGQFRFLSRKKRKAEIQIARRKSAESGQFDGILTVDRDRIFRRVIIKSQT